MRVWEGLFTTRAIRAYVLVCAFSVRVFACLRVSIGVYVCLCLFVRACLAASVRDCVGGCVHEGVSA